MDKVREFWEPIVFVDGKLNEAQVMDELADYLVMLNEVPTVYCEITGGLLSKPLYLAETVLAEFRDRHYDKETVASDLTGIMEAAITLDELKWDLRDYFDLSVDERSKA